MNESRDVLDICLNLFEKGLVKIFGERGAGVIEEILIVIADVLLVIAVIFFSVLSFLYLFRLILQ